jgi:hypothetical protein
VAIRPIPKQGEHIQVTATQEIVLRAGERPAEPGPSLMVNKGVLVYTQVNGPFDAQERMEAQVTVERFEFEESVAEQPKPAIDGSKAKGRSLLVVFDRSGKLVGIKVPPDLSEISARLTQVLAGAYGVLNFIPAATLGTGESTSSVSELPMRLPGNVSSAPVQANTTLTLRSIEGTGKDRTARMVQRIEVATETSTLKMSGGGTIDVNVARGFVSANDTEWVISGAMPGAAGGTDAHAVNFYATIRMTASAN